MSACDNYVVCKLPEKRKGVKGVLPSEARKANSMGGVLGEWGPGGTSAAERFSCISRSPSSLF